ncbi:hypothetical protein [Streptomyces olivaceiscleroticus]|uniref:hypothetical protein n=1 Tax=Streptomyces olivaceiscleroticus TaxID=68245 RepID=UPI0031FA12EE
MLEIADMLEVAYGHVRRLVDCATGGSCSFGTAAWAPDARRPPEHPAVDGCTSRQWSPYRRPKTTEDDRRRLKTAEDG